MKANKMTCEKDMQSLNDKVLLLPPTVQQFGYPPIHANYYLVFYSTEQLKDIVCKKSLVVGHYTL